VYTSLYQPVIEELTPLIASRYPEVKVQWYRAGSEVVSRRLESELRAGGTAADVLVTSDPFFYAKLGREGRLRPYVTPAALAVPRAWVDEEGRWVACRVSTMVLAYHPEAIGEAEVPRTFEALAEARYRGRVAMGDPLASGTMFTTVAFWQARYGWSWFEALRRNEVVATGGNSAVMRRVEGKESSVGVVLLENVLAAQAEGSPVRYVLPEDGVVSIPGPVALLAGSDNPRGAEAVWEVLMSPAGQAAMVRGRMHAPSRRVAAPPGAPGLEVLEGSAFGWTPEFLQAVEQESGAIKTRYDAVMNR
jgi:iron(III) transport system substrate-binding protein